MTCCRYNTSLRQLELLWNNLGDDSALVLADVLPRLTRLKKLVLCNCRTGERGVRALAAAVVRNSSLTRLSVNCDDKAAEEELMAALHLESRGVKGKICNF